MARNEISITARVDDKASPALNQLAQNALATAAAHKRAAEETAKAAGQTEGAQKAVLTATQATTLAIQQQAAGGKTLQSALVQLRRASLEVEAQLRDQAKAGKELDAGQVALAAQLRNATAATQAQIRAQQDHERGTFNLSDSLKSLAIGYVSVQGAVELVRAGWRVLIADTIALGDELDATSAKLGVSVEGLQELRFAAQASNVEASAMEGAIARLNDAIAEAVTGDTKAIEAFNQLGTTFADAQGKARPVESVLRDVADGLAATDTQAERTRLAMELFGKSGADLLPVLQGGAGELATFAARARELGIVSTETATKAAETDQAFNELAAAARALAVDVGEPLLSPVRLGAQALASIAVAAREGGAAFGVLEGVARSMLGPLSSLIEGFRFATLASGTASAASRELAGATQEATQEQTQAAIVIPGLVISQEDLAAARERDARAAEAQAAATARAAEAQARARDRAAAALLETLPEPSDQQGAAAAALDEREAANNARIDAFVTQRAAIYDRDREYFESVEAAKVAAAERSTAAMQSITVQGATAAATALGSAIGSIMTGTVKAEKAFAKLGGSLIQIGLQATQQLIAQQATRVGQTVAGNVVEGSTSAIAAHAGIPFVGLQIGLAAAGAIVAAIMGAAAGFKEGGIVQGGITGQDSVPAMLTPGEVVLPVAMVRRLQGLMGGSASEAAPVRVGAAQAFAEGGLVKGASGEPMPAAQVTINFSSAQLPDRAQWDRFVRDQVAPSLRRLRWQGGEG